MARRGVGRAGREPPAQVEEVRRQRRREAECDPAPPGPNKRRAQGEQEARPGEQIEGEIPWREAPAGAGPQDH